jgi:hypothetical protein
MTPDLTEADRLAADVAAALAEIRRMTDDALARVRAWGMEDDNR